MPDPSTGQPLRLASYNIKSGLHQPGGLERVAATIRALRPAVLALQEVDRGTDRSAGVDQTAMLAEATGLEHHAFGVATPWFGRGEYGIALLSRFPLQLVQTTPLWVPADLDVPASLREPRALLSASVDAEGVPLRVFVAHLGLSDEQRRIQAREILAAVRQASVHAHPVLMGDFNEAPGAGSLQPLMDVLTDAHAGLDTGRRGTFPTGVPAGDRIVIDYVMIPSTWRVLDAGVLHDEETPHASDHYALFADVEPA